MATPERDYTTETNRTIYTRESNGTAWFVGIIVVLALLAIGYLVFSANSGPSSPTSVEVNTTPAVEAPAMSTPAPSEATPAPSEPMTAPAAQTPAETTAPAPMTDAAPVDATPATAPADAGTTTPAAPAAQ